MLADCDEVGDGREGGRGGWSSIARLREITDCVVSPPVTDCVPASPDTTRLTAPLALPSPAVSVNLSQRNSEISSGRFFTRF